MSYETSEISTTNFKVKDPEKFQEEFKNNVHGDGKDLFVETNGFRIVGTNLYWEPKVDDLRDVIDLIHLHILKGSKAFVSVITTSSRDMACATRFLVTDLAINSLDLEETDKILTETIMPRRLIALEDHFDFHSKVWIRKNDEVTLRYKDCHKEMEVVTSEGHVIPYVKTIDNKELYHECT